MKKFQPLNTQEELLYGMLLRLDALTDMMSSFMEHYAKQNEVVTESIKEEMVQEEKPKTRKRTPKK